MPFRSMLPLWKSTVLSVAATSGGERRAPRLPGDGNCLGEEYGAAHSRKARSYLCRSRAPLRFHLGRSSRLRWVVRGHGRWEWVARRGSSGVVAGLVVPFQAKSNPHGKRATALEPSGWPGQGLGQAWARPGPDLGQDAAFRWGGRLGDRACSKRRRWS